MKKQDGFITEFLDNKTLSALSDFLSKNENFNKYSDIIATAFGAKPKFSTMKSEDVSKLIVSFKNNLTLLIQKTWVEKSDITLKDQLLYQLNELLKTKTTWSSNYSLFLKIINQAVYLMFGQPTDDPEFCEYTLRIDPEFGVFWWYISSLPPKTEWPEEKCRVAMMLGMYFLANY
ncbi:MAG: hypothetical protein IKX23_06355 [Treponema sp.]|nr:hypothetical protein [Treponema sp.]